MATVTGLTAERMQEIIDQQIVAGAVDLSGHLKMTRADGTFFDAGLVKGDKGDNAVYAFPNYVSGTDVRYVRIGVMDGIHTNQGAAMQFVISGLGGFGTARRGTVLVHAAQRGVGGVNLTAWSWGLDATAAGAIDLYTRQMGDFLFEIWAKLGTYIPKATLLLLSAFGSTVTLDSQTTVAPSSLVAGTITRSDSPMATQTLAGISELATNAEVQAGTDAVRTVTPAGLASVVGIGTGYRFVQRVVFTSSGTFTKATYPGLRAIRVMLVGGGGGGGGAATGASGQNSQGSGGGGGGYAESFITDIAGLAASIPVTVGAGGTRGSSSAGNAGNGSDSSFGTLVAAGGGFGGYGKSSSTLGGYLPAGPPGEGITGDILIGGSGGGSGFGQNTLASGGHGGSSQLGGGGNAVGTGAGGGNSVGSNGRNYGGGGGGAMTNSGGPGVAGGLGANGVVIVEIYR